MLVELFIFLLVLFWVLMNLTSLSSMILGSGLMSIFFMVIMLSYTSSEPLMVLFYLFVGGILSVISFFISFSWSPFFRINKAVVILMFFLSSDFFFGDKFQLGGVMEDGVSWSSSSMLLVGVFLIVIWVMLSLGLIVFQKAGGVRFFAFWGVSFIWSTRLLSGSVHL